MRAMPAQTAEFPEGEQPEVSFSLAPGFVHPCDGGQLSTQVDDREGRRELACLVRTLWKAGRPVLFLDMLCFGIAGSVARVDVVLAFVFLLAGLSALVAFAFLATRGVGHADSSVVQGIITLRPVEDR